MNDKEWNEGVKKRKDLNYEDETEEKDEQDITYDEWSWVDIVTDAWYFGCNLNYYRDHTSYQRYAEELR